MSYKIRIPSTNPDTIGRFAVTPGTPDAIITFPNESGEVATTSDIPQGGSSTTYLLQNTYDDLTITDPQPITEWDVPVVAGKVYKFEYSLYGRTDNTSMDFKIFYQTSSFSNPLIFSIGDANYGSPGSYNLSTHAVGLDLAGLGGGFGTFSAYWTGFFKATETGTLRHLVQNPTAIGDRGGYSSSYSPNESFLIVTQLN